MSDSITDILIKTVGTLAKLVEDQQKIIIGRNVFILVIWYGTRTFTMTSKDKNKCLNELYKQIDYHFRRIGKEHDNNLMIDEIGDYEGLIDKNDSLIYPEKVDSGNCGKLVTFIQNYCKDYDQVHNKEDITKFEHVIEEIEMI